MLLPSLLQKQRKMGEDFFEVVSAPMRVYTLSRYQKQTNKITVVQLQTYPSKWTTTPRALGLTSVHHVWFNQQMTPAGEMSIILIFNITHTPIVRAVTYELFLWVFFLYGTLCDGMLSCLFSDLQTHIYHSLFNKSIPVSKMHLISQRIPEWIVTSSPHFVLVQWSYANESHFPPFSCTSPTPRNCLRTP